MKKSAGLLAYKMEENNLLVFLVHPGGPFWKNKDDGAWSIPKGEFTDDEDAFHAAKREFEEETGIVSNGHFTELKPSKQKSGKLIFAWAVEQEIDTASVISNMFEMEWPPRSGKRQSFPEIDRGEWFTSAIARLKINPGQAAFVNELEELMDLRANK